MKALRRLSGAVILCCLVLWTFSLFASTAWLLYSSSEPVPCGLDNEGSWSIGIYKAAASPFALQPLELVSPRQDTHVAWPVANPVFTCASVSDSPSNFVADPFLWHHTDGKLYMLFESKSAESRRGEIGAAVSTDGGRSFSHMAVVLREPWHLSYPFLFQHGGRVYMLPEGSSSGALHLYQAEQFPLRWRRLEQPLIDRPLVDASIVEWQGRWYMFASDHTRPGVRSNGALEIWHAKSPLGPWQQHAANPVVRNDRGGSARSGGRPFVHEGRLYRWGQDCQATYGHRLELMEVTQLSPTAFKQRPAAHNISGLPAQPSAKPAWNSARHHHVDLLRLPSGEWVAAMDGDITPSGPVSARLMRTAAMMAAPWALLAAAYAAAGVWARHRHVLRRWLLLTLDAAAASDGAQGTAGSGISRAAAALCWPLRPLRPLVRPLAALALQVYWRRRKAKTSQVFVQHSHHSSSDLEEGDGLLNQALTQDGSGGLLSPTPGMHQGIVRLHHNLSARDVKVLSPTAGGLQLVAHAEDAALLHSGAVPWSPTAAKGATSQHAARWGQQRVGGWPTPSRRRRLRQFRVLGLPLRAVALACTVLATASAAAGLYAYAAPYFEPPRALAVDGQRSQFTLLVMTYESRLASLRHFVRHYSRCPSVSDIVVVWNKGTPPVPERDFDSAVPVRVRVEAVNSLNNRFKEDPAIRNRGVLSLDDDIMMPCQDLERGFARWRMRPEKMLGFYPRLIEGAPQLVFRGERYAVERGAYNAILTGAAFIDTWTAFPAYWADAVAPAREEVNKVFNGEDLLMNFVLANRTRAVQALHDALCHNRSAAAEAERTRIEQAFWGGGLGQGMHAGDLQVQRSHEVLKEGTPWSAVEFLRPSRRLDISKLSGVGISHNWDGFKAAAKDYLQTFVATFGYNPLQTQSFNWQESRVSPPMCSIGFLGCAYL